MTQIDIFPWERNFEIGIEPLDKQHRQLVDILNRLAEQFMASACVETLETVFEELAAYAAYNFETEESLWQQYLADKPSVCTHHLDSHQAFISQLSGLRAMLADKPVGEAAEQTLNFLVRWLVTHVLESDRYLAAIVKAKQQGLTTDQALVVARSSMQDASAVLMNIIRSMYVSHSLNTLRLAREVSEQRQAAANALQSQSEALAISHWIAEWHLPEGWR